jgi:hypothetical protein
MDEIDITDSAFSLNIPETNEIININGGSSNDYTTFIYIGIAVLVLFIGMFVYKYYNKKNNMDCEGGFCTMNNGQNKQL